MALYHNFSLPVPRGKVAWAREMRIDHPTPRSSGRGWALRASEGTCSEGTLGGAPGKAGASQWLTGSPTRERGVPPATCLPPGRRVPHPVAGAESRRRAKRELLDIDDDTTFFAVVRAILDLEASPRPRGYAKVEGQEEI